MYHCNWIISVEKLRFRERFRKANLKFCLEPANNAHVSCKNLEKVASLKKMTTTILKVVRVKLMTPLTIQGKNEFYGLKNESFG